MVQYYNKAQDYNYPQLCQVFSGRGVFFRSKYPRNWLPMMVGSIVVAVLFGCFCSAGGADNALP